MSTVVRNATHFCPQQKGTKEDAQHDCFDGPRIDGPPLPFDLRARALQAWSTTMTPSPSPVRTTLLLWMAKRVPEESEADQDIIAPWRGIIS